MDWTRHLLVVPILLPLVTGASLLLIDETRHTLKALVSHPLTDKGLAQFLADWAKTGQKIG